MKLAIVIGVSEYDSDRYANLKACQNDAELFKNVITNVTTIDDIVYINDSPKSSDVKKQITDFVAKYKNSSVDELIFYFSGHGERYDEDFFYICSDFNEKRKETTGLRNTEIDGFARALKPKFFVKIIDACFSGTRYIKSEDSTEYDLRKSATDNELQDIYFMFSSREDKTSLAGDEFSKFSESLFTAVLERTGETRYRDLAGAIADDFVENGGPRPIFAHQAGLVELFGNITDTTHEIINKAFGLSDDQGEKSDTTNKDDASENKSTDNDSLLKLVIEKDKTLYCDEATALETFTALNNAFLSQNWPEIIQKLYAINIFYNLQPFTIPSIYKIGQWLISNTNKEYFAAPLFKEERFEVEEYREIPQKPNIARLVSYSKMFGGRNDVEYKLEKVVKTRQVVSGLKHTYANDNNIFSMQFEPKHSSTRPIYVYVILMYSRVELVIQYTYEFAKYTSWNSLADPKCETWKLTSVRLKDKISVVNSVHEIIKEISEWAETSIKNDYLQTSF